MEKANNMMTDNDMMCWHALYTAPKSEHKLMQRLNAAGYTTYCPMQAVFVKWKGHTRKVCLNPSEGKYGLEIPSNTWHSIIALESGTVIFEIKKGPYQPLPSEDLASWAPQTSDTEGIKAFMKRMLEL